MPRLRITSGLSALALIIGVAVTSWLSMQTSSWTASPISFPQSPSDQATSVPAVALEKRARHRLHATVDAALPPSTDVDGGAQERLPVRLTPLSMPADQSVPWYQLRGHLDGRVVIHVDVDANGRVVAASVRQTSGDWILDDHALRSVRLWRFAVPPDQADGFSGDLPMRFSSSAQVIARTP